MGVQIKYEIGQKIGECIYKGNETVTPNRRTNKRSADFICRCGKLFHATIADVKSLNTLSCGCWNEIVLKTKPVTHGRSRTSEYKSWCGMKERCYKKDHKKYPMYGGRGIKVCDRWLNSFENFLYDVGKKPSKEHTLDRFPDKNGDYGPNNCRWASKKEQAQNTRSNRWIEYNGERKVLAEWALYFGVDQSVLSYHFKVRTMGQIVEFYKRKGKICC